MDQNTLIFNKPPLSFLSHPCCSAPTCRRAHLAGSSACAPLLCHSCARGSSVGPLRAPRASRRLLPPLWPRPGSPRASYFVGLCGTDDLGWPRGCGAEGGRGRPPCGARPRVAVAVESGEIDEIASLEHLTNEVVTTPLDLMSKSIKSCWALRASALRRHLQSPAGPR